MTTTWDKLQHLPSHVQEMVNKLYSDLFPIEVRYILSKWLDNMNCWEDFDIDNQAHEEYLQQTIIPAMFEEIKKCIATSDMAMKFRLSKALAKMENSYSQSPFHLVRVIKMCLHQEQTIVRQFESGLLPIEDGFNSKHNPAIDDQLEHLKSLRDGVQRYLPLMKQEHEQLALSYSAFKKQEEYLKQHPPNIPPEQWTKLTRDFSSMEENLKKKAAIVSRNRLSWLDKFESCWSLTLDLLHKVVDEDLERWKRDQQLAGNTGKDLSGQSEKTLSVLQTRCEILAETLWMNHQQLMAFGDLCNEARLHNNNLITDKLPSLKQQVQMELHRLVRSTFLVEKQPPQVMKTNTRFASTVRLLVGIKLNVQMSSPNVSVSIISESNAKAFLNSGGKTVESSGEIINHKAILEYHSGLNQLTANFRNMQLRKIKRAEKKGTESVMDEKFALLFQSTFKIANGEFSYAVHALSLPVVVIVHGNQEPHAWATVTWDNAFAVPSRVPFLVPDKVPWFQVGEVLSRKFKSYVGRDLNADALRFLAGKAFRNFGLADYDHMQLSWNQFAKEALPDRSFTLWEWFYALLKVTKEHMRNLWIDGTIVGFISRKQTEELLLQCQPGTFLLRFSDTELGGVTIAWIGETADGSPEVYMLQPFTSRDFAIRGLADRISDLHNLLYLYPNTPKEHAFGKYYTPLNDRQTLPNGYVKHALALTLPGMNSGSLDFPNTPPSNLGFNPHSPESTSYHDPGSVPSVANDYMPGASGSSVPDDILDLVDSMEFDINDLENILRPQQ